MTSFPWQNGPRAKTNLPFLHWLGWGALSQQQAAQLTQPHTRRIAGSRALRSDELTNQITVVSSDKSKSRHGREFYVTQETKHSRYHQSLTCIPVGLSLWHTCLVFLRPRFCLVPEGVWPAHKEDGNTEGLMLLRGSSTQCLRRGGIWTPQFPPPTDSNSGACICTSPCVCTETPIQVPRGLLFWHTLSWLPSFPLSIYHPLVSQWNSLLQNSFLGAF